MKVTIGSTVIAAGTASGEPARLIAALGTAEVQQSHTIRAKSAKYYPRGNIAYIDTIEADYSYSTPQAAQQAIHTLRHAALTATGTLIYGDGATAETIGPALCHQAELIHWAGCGITIRYEIQASKQETP